MPTVHIQATSAGNGWLCHVAVANGAETHHRVCVSRSDLGRLDPGATEPDALVRASFAFLLEREPPASILREFDLTVIGRYYPDYEGEIAARMRRS